MRSWTKTAIKCVPGKEWQRRQDTLHQDSTRHAKVVCNSQLVKHSHKEVLHAMHLTLVHIAGLLQLLLCRMQTLAQRVFAA